MVGAFFLEKLQIRKLFDPQITLTLAKQHQLVLLPVTVRAQHRRGHFTHLHHTCLAILCWPMLTTPWAVWDFSLMVLGQVLLEEALQHGGRLCCIWTLKKSTGVIAASEPRGCPDCCTGLSTLCLLWALAVPAWCSEHWARTPGAGLSLFAGGAPCSSWKNARINLSPPEGFPHSIQTFGDHPGITLRKPECCRTRMFLRPSPWMKFSALEQCFSLGGDFSGLPSCSWQGWKWWVLFFEGECY